MTEPGPSPKSIGPYSILELLGRGGMGVVYRARHQETGRLAALKTVRVPRQELLSGIRREIHTLAGLQHPGIVQIVGEGVHDGVPWYAMELLEGVTLRQHLTAQPGARTQTGLEPQALQTWWTQSLLHPAGQPEASGEAPAASPDSSKLAVPSSRLRQVLDLVRRLCAPLAFLHGEGLVHRDLKPENVLVRPDGTPVVVDFGLAARFGGELSREALQVDGWSGGTLAFMAPEQLRGELGDARADLYALGCILYWALTGQMPFQTIEAVRDPDLEARPPSELAAGVPQALDALVLELLCKTPRQRLGHADAVAAALEALGAEKEAGPAGPGARAYLYRPEMAGRRDLLEALGKYVTAQLRTRAGGIVLVGGESGIGKTRLVLELARQVQAQARVRVLGGESAVGGGPLHPLRGVLQHLADSCAERDPEETRRLLGPWAKVLAPYEPALGAVPGQEQHPEPAVETQDFVSLPPQEARLRIFDALAQALAALQADEPVLLLLDDLQWADELTLGFLEFWLQALHRGAQRPAALVIVGTYRTEEAGEALRPLVAAPKARSLTLERLDEEAIGSMVGDMLAMDPAPELFARFLARQSEGNPFFVAEYLRTAVAEGLLWRDTAGRWEVADPAGAVETQDFASLLPLPRSIQDLVGRRLEGLAHAARQLAEAAAVLGREMDGSLLRRMTGLQEAELFSATAELLRRQVMEEAGDGQLRFEHDKIREVAYQRIDADRRPALHRAAAEAMEAVAEAGRQEQLGELGRHWEAAGEPRKAAACYLPAARAAAARYAHDEAERLYRAYLRLVESPSLESIAAHNVLGEKILAVRGRNDQALAEHEQALGEARQLGDRTLEGVSLRLMGLVHWKTGRTAEARQFYESALALHRQAGDRQNESKVIGNLALLHDEQGQPEQARQLYEQALAIERQHGDRWREGTTLGNLANLHLRQGRLEQAQPLYLQALDLIRQAGDRLVEGVVLGNLAMLRRRQRLFDESRELYEQALLIQREVGDRRGEGISLGNFGNLEQQVGRLPQARALYDRALEIQREVGNRRGAAIICINLAELVHRLGHLEEARQLDLQALDLLRQVGDRQNEAIVLSSLASLNQEQGRLDEARQHFEQALDLARQLGDRRLEGSVLGGLANLDLLAAEDRPRAQKLAEEAERLLEAMGARLELGKVLCCQGHIALAGGRSDEGLLGRADALARAEGAAAESDLGKSVSSLRRAVAAFEAGEPGRLFRGHLPEDLPEALRQALARPGQLPGAASAEAP